jgi:DNA segregation ATPase FtsK/SpoIIIE-like protein
MYQQFCKLANETPYYAIPIQKGVTWSLRSAPHALLSGITGYGKSYLANYVIAMTSIKGATLYLADPKNSDIANLSDYMPSDRVVYEAKNICSIVEDVVNVMMSRYELMKRERIKSGLFQADFADFGLPIVILVIDELAAFLSTLDKKERESFNANIKAITLQGRQAGVNICNIMQNPSAENISTESRSQMGFRVFLGNSGGIEYRMLFGEGYKYPSRTYKPGQGLYMLSGKTIQPEFIETPRLDKSQLAETMKLALVPQYERNPLTPLCSRSGA